MKPRDRPLLSIVTITYKDVRGLEKTLRSLEVLESCELSWEHVVIDSSPEENAHLFEKQVPYRHRVVTPADGIYNALNSGIREASGEIIWFLNSGDVLESPSALKACLGVIAQDESLGFLCAAASLRDAEGQYLYDRAPRGTLLESILGYNSVSHQAVLYRRIVFDRVGLYDPKYRLASDYDHFFRCFMEGIRTVCVEDRFVGFDMTGSSRNFRLAFSEFKEIHRAYENRLGIRLAFLNELYRMQAYLKHLVMEWVGTLGLKRWLRPLWIGYKRCFKPRS